MLAIYGRQILDTLHERVGDEEQIRGNPALADSDKWTNGIWGRTILRQGHTSGDTLGIYGNDGPSYKSDLIAFQAGLDVYRHTEKRNDGTEGDRDHAGIIGSWGTMDAEIDHNLIDFKFRAGKVDMQSWSLGAFWTHFEPNGAYLDLVGQVTWHDIRMRSLRFERAKTNGFGLALSAEGGYPVPLDEDWKLEPQVQLIYQSFDIDSFDDPAAHVRFRDLDSLTGRAGFRLAHVGNLEGWLHGNIWHEFLGGFSTEFSSADGYVPFETKPPVTWWQVGAGISFLLHPQLTLFGQGSYEEAFNADSHAWTAKIGVRVNWR
jgi:outer membrane autotransporter protein